ncbi:MAG: hypothetical protein ABI867_39805, partial [Kofleriaceae bacterium]
SDDADKYCGAVDSACERLAKDAVIVNCTDLDDAVTAAGRCVSAIEQLDGDCLPRLSSRREAQFARGKKAYDQCRDILAYKKANSLCK